MMADKNVPSRRIATSQTQLEFEKEILTNYKFPVKDANTEHRLRGIKVNGN